MHVLDRLETTRIVAKPAALDALAVSAMNITLRTAPDELYILPPADVSVADEAAIIVEDTSLSGVWLEASEALDILERIVEWRIPTERPALAQGMIAGIPGKLWLEQERVLLIVPTVYSAEMEERLH